MKRTLWAWSFYHPSVKILRSRCDSRLAGVDQDSCDLWGLGEVRVVFCFLLVFFFFFFHFFVSVSKKVERMTVYLEKL